jgi:hypothetical protein
VDRLIKWCMMTLASHSLENTEASNITSAQGGPVIRGLRDRVGLWTRSGDWGLIDNDEGTITR